MVMFANLSLFYSENHTLQVILKHDDFCTVIPLDNKTNTKKILNQISKLSQPIPLM